MELIAAHAGKNVAQRTNDSSTVLMIDGMPFQTIKTVQVMLELLLQCITFCDTAPAFTPDVSQRVVGLLRTFNSRTCQLILGAGAMQVCFCPKDIVVLRAFHHLTNELCVCRFLD